MDIDAKVLVLDEKLAFDPVFSHESHRLSGLYVREAGDSIQFIPGPDLTPAMSWELRQDANDKSVGFLAPVGVGRHEVIQGARLRFDTGLNGCHSVVIPELGSPHSPRVVWSIRSRSEVQQRIAVIGNTFPFVTALLRPDRDDADLNLSQLGSVQIQLTVGHGLRIGCRGEFYAFILLLRLVKCNQPFLNLELRMISSDLEIHCTNAEDTDIEFLLTPFPKRDIKYIAGVPSSSLRISEIALVLGPPFPPRLLLDIGSGMTSALDRPLSWLPLLGHARASFPLLLIGTRQQILWPMTGHVASDVVATAIRGIVYFGEASESLMKDLMNAANLKFVGLVGAGAEHTVGVIPGLVCSSAKIAAGESVFARENGKSIGVLSSMDIPTKGEQIDKFLIQAMKEVHGDWPRELSESWDLHVSERLPQLPFCLDLAVAMELMLGNRHRGRLMRDAGSDEVDYSEIARDEIWLSPWNSSSIRDRGDLMVEIALRTTSEYLAFRLFSTMFHQLDCTSSDQSAEVNCENLEESAQNLVLSWERLIDLGMERLDEARKRFIDVMQSHRIGKYGALQAIASAFLLRLRSSDQSEESTSETLTRLNPLVLIFATGGEDQRDMPLEVASAYWANYAAGFSGGKPGAIIASLLPHSEIAEACRRQYSLRIALRYFDTTREDHQSVDLRMKREDLGNLVASKLEPAALRVLSAADADRVVAFSTVLLDFVPFGGTILGLERPLSRLPVSTDIASNYAMITSAALSSSTNRASGFALVLFAGDPKDEAERWANGVGKDIQGILPFLGFNVLRVQESSNPTREILNAIQQSELLVFVGHGSVYEEGAALDAGNCKISDKELGALEWTGKIALLIGCETAAIDVANRDLAGILLKRGARAVIGTAAEVRIEVAESFLQAFFRYTTAGESIDYAFCLAKRECVLAEALVASGLSWNSAVQKASGVAREKSRSKGFACQVSDLGMSWEQVYTSAVFSLAWTLSGGAAERMR